MPSSWQMGSWNVHSMVDIQGPVEVVSSRGKRVRKTGEDKKVDQIVHEMRRHNVKVVLQ